MLIVNKKIKKFLETLDVRLQEKNLRTVVELIEFKLAKIEETKINPPITASNIFFDLKI